MGDNFSDLDDPSRATVGSMTSHSSNTGDDDPNVAIPEAMAALQRINADQAGKLETVQQHLNQSKVKHGGEVYWLRLELDSSRREKESAEDRMAELYRDIQELLSSSINDSDGQTLAGSDNVDGICTEPDYVHALHDRLTAFERSIEILNRQIEMIKTSSEVVVASMKQEVTDLVEEKSLMELDLLNQISNLDNAKRRLECQLSAYGEEAKQEREQRMGLSINTSSNTNKCVQAPTMPSELEAAPQVPKENGIVALESGNDMMSFEGIISGGVVRAVESGKVHEESFHSTGTTQCLFTNDVTPMSISDESGDVQGEQALRRIESLEEEVWRWNEEARSLKIANLKLHGKAEELTKELHFTRSTTNMALALDRIETDRVETVAHLDRIAILWDRADSTIQITESLLAELQPRTALADCHPSNQMDRERLLSTLEAATLVHGQLKMSLMLIELTFRNHLTCIQNDNLQELESIHLPEKLEQLRVATLSAISKLETKWTVAAEQVERRIIADNQSIHESLRGQLGALQQAQDRQKSLESELRSLKEHPSPSANHAVDYHPVSSALVKTEGEDTKLELLALSQSDDPPDSSGVLVSRSVIFRLQQEILSVVAVVQEKNEAIGLLMATIDKYRLWEDALKRELKRAKLNKEEKITKDDGINLALRKNKLDVPMAPMSVHNRGKKKASSTPSKESPGAGKMRSEPSSPSSVANMRQKRLDGSDRGWSSL